MTRRRSQTPGRKSKARKSGNANLTRRKTREGVNILTKPVQPVKLLVTGGAGFLGVHLVAVLQQAAIDGVSIEEIRILDLKKYVALERDKNHCVPVKFFEGSILDEAILAKACTGVDFVRVAS